MGESDLEFSWVDEGVWCGGAWPSIEWSIAWPSPMPPAAATASASAPTIIDEYASADDDSEFEPSILVDFSRHESILRRKIASNSCAAFFSAAFAPWVDVGFAGARFAIGAWRAARSVGRGSFIASRSPREGRPPCEAPAGCWRGRAG